MLTATVRRSNRTTAGKSCKFDTYVVESSKRHAASEQTTAKVTSKQCKPAIDDTVEPMEIGTSTADGEVNNDAQGRNLKSSGEVDHEITSTNYGEENNEEAPPLLSKDQSTPAEHETVVPIEDNTVYAGATNDAEVLNVEYSGQ